MCLHKLVAFRVANATDYWNGLELAEEKGRNKGLEDGRKQGRQEQALSAARNALALNLPLAQISQITGLPLAEVEKLAAGTDPVLA